MSGGESSKQRKQQYFAKLVKYLDEYPAIFIVGADNVPSNQMSQIRQALRGRAEVLMGKNTMIRKAIRGHAQNNPKVEALLPLVRGNIGFVFCKGDLSEVKKVLSSKRVEAAAKQGVIAPSDVFVPAMNTGLEPTQTSFFQALNIPTKITKGQIEIVQDVHLIKEGFKVGASEANLLQKLAIKPFTYGLTLGNVYDNGAIYNHKVLDLTDADLLGKFFNGVRNVAALGLQIGYPTVASLPHSIARAFKNILSITLVTDLTFPQAQKYKDYLANPSAFAAAAPAPAEAPAKGGKEAAAKKPEKVEEEKPESDQDMGFGLFD
jgi:large subunit ribosomal protein LP0